MLSPIQDTVLQPYACEDRLKTTRSGDKYLPVTPLMFPNQRIKYVYGNDGIEMSTDNQCSTDLNQHFPDGRAMMISFRDNGHPVGIATGVDFGPRISDQHAAQIVAEFQAEVVAFLAKTGIYAGENGNFSSTNFTPKGVERVHGSLALRENFRISQLLQLGGVRHALGTGFNTLGFLSTHETMNLSQEEMIDDHLRIATALERYGRLVGALGAFKEESINIEAGLGVVQELLENNQNQFNFYSQESAAGVELDPTLLIHVYEMMINAEKHARNVGGINGLSVTMQSGVARYNSGDYLQLVVYDNVPSGLDPEVSIEMFTKGKSTSGTLGLGLFEALKEVTAAGGTVRAVDLRNGVSYIPSVDEQDFGVAHPQQLDIMDRKNLVLANGNTTAFIIEVPLRNEVLEP